MSNPKFQMGDKVENVKTKRVGFVKKQRGASVYLVSIQGFGEREWNEAEMVKIEDSPKKWDNTFNRPGRRTA
jgi:hypothetical protein